MIGSGSSVAMGTTLAGTRSPKPRPSALRIEMGTIASRGNDGSAL